MIETKKNNKRMNKNTELNIQFTPTEFFSFFAGHGPTRPQKLNLQP